MKFAIFALIAGFCLVTVNADTLPTDLSEGHVEIEGQTFGSIHWMFKKALRTGKYLHCSVDVVFRMERATENYIASLHSCTVVFTTQVENVVKSLKTVIGTINNILNINTKICNFESPSDVLIEEVPEGIPEPEELYTKWSCYWKLLKQFDNLEHQSVAATKLVLGLPKDGAALGECMVASTNDLTSFYGSFNDKIKGCTKK